MLNNVNKAFGNSEVVSVVFLWLICFYCIIDDKMWKKKSYHLVYEKEDTERPEANNTYTP